MIKNTFQKIKINVNFKMKIISADVADFNIFIITNIGRKNESEVRNTQLRLNNFIIRITNTER